MERETLSKDRQKQNGTHTHERYKWVYLFFI
nr:MAG TPA: hypothetical protein [Caudoviricetes sp.]